MRGAAALRTSRSRALRGEQTDAERKLWSALRGRQLGGFKFVRQEPIGPFFADFVCRDQKLVIEVDGATHSTDEERDYDRRREAFLREAGYRVVRVTNDDVFRNLDGVCETILAALQ
ncbi:endonuclease domain-containing protein [Rhodoblastus acidophilus]|uniref:Endonuclease domain-containing protein n=1 Tax=Candidatus Rhodoblastus alkanivorans TaxID=2954117 RepID=A0ABS9Z553_9HYPH|nr:endonuclease domain-containing protein [Candidatus Rhodoblastus alkanivorans]MCI4680581.1 endonuclease domain-containing protein [Candidatus Rhodoblastus alkanivorans]MCI4682500.1 endonuclease domain-containing protein [Candidatus Rhodoblastus alkanivorans]MDI4639806.1 endonuclease domain-containing protein [Rhodoblastus acidophilus]